MPEPQPDTGAPIHHVQVLRAPALCTVQDAGRIGQRHLGLARCGAMDTQALAQALALVGLPPQGAALEFAMGPLELRFERETWVSLCGAQVQATLAGRALASGWRRRAAPGEVLRVQGLVQGRWAYLAFDGGLALPPVLGSFATDVAAGLGGWQGRALQAGDRLPLGPPPIPALKRACAWAASAAGLWQPAGTPRPLPGQRPQPQPLTLRLMPGPEALALQQQAPQAWAQLGAQSWRVSAQSNRMAYRLEGPPLPTECLPEMASHAVWPAWVQLPPSGQPLVLMADAQTTGGYPRLGEVFAPDLALLAQAMPGQAVRFVPMSNPEAALARQALRERQGLQAQAAWAALSC
jgi:biotin-dependent carboxylase-like uncharacterized protein